jgi:hypothetical protein
LEASLKKGERIRLRRASPAAAEWQVPEEAEATVICHYRVFSGRQDAAERLDVRFGPRRVVWGAPASEFEPIGEAP